MSARQLPTVVCSQCGTQLDDSCMVVRPVGSTASVVRQQRLALRHLDEARRVYRWWHAFAVADGLALTLSVLGGRSMLVLMAGIEKLFALLALPLIGTFAALGHTHIWPPFKKAFITRRDALWAWEDAMLADEEAER
jgi:hypothetical protein